MRTTEVRGVRRWAVGAVAGGVATVLVGCSGATQQASTTLPTTSAPAAAASPTLPALGPPDLPMPAAARQQTTAGVGAFAAYYVQLVDHSVRSLDSSAVRSLSRNCTVCDQLADQWDQAKGAGQRIDGGSLTLLSTGGVVMTAAGAEIATYLEQAALTYRDASGAAVPDRSSPAERLTGGLTLIWDSDRSTWVVTQFDADPI